MKPRIWLISLVAAAALVGLSSAITDPPSLTVRGGGRFFGSDDTTKDKKINASTTKNDHTPSESIEETEEVESVDKNDKLDAGENSDGNDGADTVEEQEAQDPASVGVKSHHHHHHSSNLPSNTANQKKSNAVGDPDGDDDDDDESDSDLTEYSEEWMDEEEIVVGETTYFEVEPELQAEVELVEEGGQDGDTNTIMVEDEDDYTDEEESSSSFKTTSSGGGVGVRLGRPRRSNKPSRGSWRGSSATSSSKQLSHDQTRLLQAWMPHVYFPPTPTALSFLESNARLLDASSKSRLDRRTLYAALLQEWGFTKSSSSGTSKRTASSLRKFLPVQTSQALQAALSMATQPQWRSSSPSINGIRLYQDEETIKGTTLGMQETIAMALAHSLGCGMLILDDNIINSVRQELAKNGFPEEALKPAALVQSLLEMAQKGKLRPAVKAGSISECMKRDLSVGLDDPFDERAAISCQEMVHWEEEWYKGIKDVDRDNVPLPLIVFLRTSTSNALLKSKSAMELLLRECGSEESIHLVTLGKGIDATTSTLPKDTSSSREIAEPPEANRRSPQSPWHGFSQQNQNASGQNDPAGSRRFNIFLARTIDHKKQPGILGAIAPPQAGNLFPQMMAMQAQARIEHQDGESSMDQEELERWRELSQQNHMQMMQNHGGMPVPSPQFFNASLAMTPFREGENDQMPPPTPPPEVIQQTLQQAMNELLDRLASAVDEDDEPMSPEELSSDVQKAFAQVLRNQNLRRGIAENLSRAAPALSDPKCQGVMLSVYVPPPMHHPNHRPNMSGSPDGRQQNNMGGWFQKILNNQDEMTDGTPGEESEAQNKQKRIRTLAAAAAVQAANKSKQTKSGEKASENKAERNLARLEQVCRPIGVGTPQDPVRAKSWESWIDRERGAIIFKQNRRALNTELANRKLALQQHTGTRGAGSALRQMLSVRDLAFEMEDVIKCSVELEAAKSLRQHETSAEMHEKEESLEVDISLSQLMLTEDGSVVESADEAITLKGTKSRKKQPQIQYIHPSSLEAALTMKSRISPSPSGGLSVSGPPASHRSREEIAALAQDKHERALVSQVVSPQDIGVTYDMIGGLSEVKELLRQSITYPLKFPHLYSEGIAREAVKGVLLFGPPGTGKTMLAKAVATEGGASFLSVDASSVENKWLGESEKNAKAVFTLARRLAPCVIFVDEVDSLLSSREGSSDDSAHGTLTSVKTTMMSEWDGLSSGTNGVGEAGSDRVVVIGSTNRPFDLDEAVLRRFPRRILVDLPDLETRKEILEVTLAENRLDPAVNLTMIAERLEGYTGSDIKEVCREAVVQISHEQARLLDQGFVNSREDVTEGSLQRLRPVTSEDFDQALSKLKKSVSEKGRELLRVWEWNDEYGEIKKEKTNRLPHLMNMYL